MAKIISKSDLLLQTIKDSKKKFKKAEQESANKEKEKKEKK